MSRLNRESPQDLPCVWVHAGVLSYRPCHRNFECETCELFRALRGPELVEEEPGRYTAPGALAVEPWGLGASVNGSAEEAVSAYLVKLTEGCDLRLDLPYSTSHFWLQEEGPDQVLLGFDCQTLRILFPVEDFLLPKPGVWVKRGEAMGWVLRGPLAIPLPAPLSGEVLEVNHALVEEVKEWGFPRSADRWLIRLRLHESLGDVPDLLQGESMLNWYQKKLSLVHGYLLDAVDPGVSTGEILNDGGELNRNLEEVLGIDAFQELVRSLFRHF